MGVLFVDDFVDLSHWSGGGFSISSGTAYHGGDGSGGGGATRAMSSGSKYVEALCWGDATGGDNWGVLKLDNAGGAAYDGNGAGFAFRSTTGEVFPLVAAGSVDWAVPDWTLPGAAYNLGYTPRGLATAVLLGLHHVASGVYDYYVNRRRMARYTGVTGATGANLYIAGYNGIGAHFDYVAEADRPLTIYDDIRAPSKMTY